ncbi:MAG: GAF domain-containing protein [Phycisphaeraceae bacterium]|nr:GAF domain-containing protein [Phycisphaeraceae bacterium]
MSARDYARVASLLGSAHRPGPRFDAMQRVVDALWEELAPKGVSWVGFYLKDPNADELTLGPRRDKPACSPIGLHGACGRSYSSRRALIVTDVANLRAGYIACDPRDRSEAVIPLFEPDGLSCWGVLDADSFDIGAFSERDVEGMLSALVAAGLTPPSTDRPPSEVV